MHALHGAAWADLHDQLDESMQRGQGAGFIAQAKQESQDEELLFTGAHAHAQQRCLSCNLADLPG